MLFGAHESVAGGLENAFERARVDGCEAIQIFTKNSSSWREPDVTDEKVAAFRNAHRASTVGTVMAHTSYLINLGSPKPDQLEKSKDALVNEVLRSSALGISYVVLHPGAHLNLGMKEAIARIAASLDEVHERTPEASARVLLENTAGQGSCVGARFEEIGDILGHTKTASRVGVCFDTQHAFAAGYDMTTADGYRSVLGEFDRHIGLSRLRAFHLNDSKKALGSRVDRHEHLGEGNLGLSLFWRLATDPQFAQIPGVLETEPREGGEPYKEEVLLLRSLATRAEAPAPAFKLSLT